MHTLSNGSLKGNCVDKVCLLGNYMLHPNTEVGTYPCPFHMCMSGVVVHITTNNSGEGSSSSAL
jgi:hypothetical protein